MSQRMIVLGSMLALTGIAGTCGWVASARAPVESAARSTPAPMPMPSAQAARAQAEVRSLSAKPIVSETLPSQDRPHLTAIAMPLTTPEVAQLAQAAAGPAPVIKKEVATALPQPQTKPPSTLPLATQNTPRPEPTPSAAKTMITLAAAQAPSAPVAQLKPMPTDKGIEEVVVRASRPQQVARVDIDSLGRGNSLTIQLPKRRQKPAR
jgi:hypothetical protein